MSIFRLTDTEIETVTPGTFSELGVRERDHLQRLLRDQIEIVAPETLVISEEFGEWQESRRRIDLLAIDKEANLVVIELKRTQDGGHMELQALRYAAMVSTLTFERAVEIYEQYLVRRLDTGNARDSLLDFLGWDEPNEDDFANDVRIVLVSAEFSRELTTAVLWLSEHQIDIRCVRIKPYRQADNILLDVQQIIPLPEAQDYQLGVQTKRRAARRPARSSSKCSVTINDIPFRNITKEEAIHKVVKALCETGVTVEQIESVIHWRKGLFYTLPGDASSDDFLSAFATGTGIRNNPDRWFYQEDDLIHSEGKTHVFMASWGNRVGSAITALLDEFHPDNILFESVS